ncbi:hypothetical protein [Streptomyces sp. NBC_01443]|uniref:hypothetical protein n=1 Tax=Streptomyces sp. NBC_01443 TaxID=2903868 RepID=UPI0022522139|nr:hypothetical protein [Streptomyces sp. NBC_01443]MCX4625312.1 hypothetical protein [Streptomyces sp. NBC_01443]
MVLTPPFEPMLAQAAEYVPGSGVLASGFAAEQKGAVGGLPTAGWLAGRVSPGWAVAR